jgi:hypothetical protein
MTIPGRWLHLIKIPWIAAALWLLCSVGLPAQSAPSRTMLDQFRQGPMGDVKEIVFASRPVVEEHWYANFSSYAEERAKPGSNADLLYRDGAQLCRLDLASGRVTTVLRDDAGGIRDPQVSYDGTKILFAYRRGGTSNYLLYEINLDGSGLRQITRGEHDDFEPSYLPDGGIVFVSSRCNRWVNCWLTKVAVLYRCNAEGGDLRPLSSNNEHDNTPWPLPDGRILYTRWEYVDRSQVDYHHLWVVNPDGTGQMTYFGNLHPGTVMIDAKPISGSDKVVAIFSPGHGQTEHAGALALVDSQAGPDDRTFGRTLTKAQNLRDPWAFSEDCFIAAQDSRLVGINGNGDIEEIFSLSPAERAKGMKLHEPRPVIAREREAVLQPRVQLTESTGRLLVTDVYQGRNMEGVNRGDIKKLLILETLPKPINYTGGMDPLSYGGTFSLERVLGTVPVENDGSAYFEVPALRSIFLVALDKDDLSVKRMQSFVTVQPGETASCVGCHEPRTASALPGSPVPLAVQQTPHRIEPIKGVPDVLDFPRDIQPVLDALCLDCHGYDRTARGGPRDGGILLSGDHGPMFSHSYFVLTTRRLFSDGRNEPRSNLKPRTIGSSASRLLKLMDGSHYGVRASQPQVDTVRLWIETGAPYPGTYAALGSGMIGGYAQNNQVETDFQWSTTLAAAEVIQRRCSGCHQKDRPLPRALSDELDISFWRFDLNDARLRLSRHYVFNLSRPEKSLLLLAPLAKASGGYGLCDTNSPQAVFGSAADPDYQKLLAMATAGRDRLAQLKRFDMGGFLPRPEWVREMRRYGVLPQDAKPAEIEDVYAVEQKYWRSLWYEAPGKSEGRTPENRKQAGGRNPNSMAIAPLLHGRN